MIAGLTAWMLLAAIFLFVVTTARAERIRTAIFLAISTRREAYPPAGWRFRENLKNPLRRSPW
jgi:hypothetical protein